MTRSAATAARVLRLMGRVFFFAFWGIWIAWGVLLAITGTSWN